MDVRKVLQELDLDRREFLRLSLMSSGALLAPASMSVAADAPAASPAYGVLRSLPPGAIQPEGWLRTYLEKQAQQLGSQLPRVSWPFTAAYWAGEEKGESWWPWEQRGYWLDGATRLALVLDDKQLMRQVRVPIEYTLSHAAADGYLGPDNFKDPKGECHRWPHTVFFRALAAFSDAQQRSDIAQAMRHHYLSDPASYGLRVRNVTNIETILWCYGRTGDPKLLALAEDAWRDFMTVAGKNLYGDLTSLRVFGATPINSHGVTYIETAKLPAILYMYTGKPEYLKFSLAAQRRIFDHHMLIDGIPSTTEWYRTRTSLDSHETCDITDHAWSWSYLLMATGDGVWADHVERASLNAGMGAIKKDWKGVQYFSCANQFLATINSDHNAMEQGGRMMAYQPNPGHDIACCGGNVHRLFPNYVISMWMKDADNGVAATLYGPSKLRTTAGKHNQEVEISQETDYPFGERVDFMIRTKQPVEFPLSFRVPGWCTAPSISLNGRPVDVPQIRRGFITIHRKFQPNDKVSLNLPMRIAVTRWPQNGVGMEHGPLVYSLAIKESWTPVVEAKYTTAEFPGWNATPATAWNYALAASPATLASAATIERKGTTSDPWIDPPVSMTVDARKVENWQLQSNPENAAQKFTPPLPVTSEMQLGEVEKLILVPYGSTHLRLTIFPSPHPETDPSPS